MSVIDAYKHFKVGVAVASIPYFNNKTIRRRGGLRVMVGKGSPKDIQEEVSAIAVKQHVSLNTLADESLKKFLVDNAIGIDCSAFSYYILEAESVARGQNKLNKHISYVHAHGPMSKMKAHLRPVENCGVSTLAAEANSRVVNISEVKPGDFISMLSGIEEAERNHILVIHAVDYDNEVPVKIYYSHAISYPEDGIYGSGIKQGTISITDPKLDLFNQKWTEGGNADFDPYADRIKARARSSKTELRRLKWL